jgi:hypothetical protein
MARLALALTVLLAAVLIACQSAPAPGTPCQRSADCSSPLVCTHARCRDECRQARDCAVGLRCLLDASGLGACTLGSETTCRSDAECGSDLVCAGGQCRTTCASDLACGTGGACLAGSCVQPASGDDAGASAIDAGEPRDAHEALSDGGRPATGTGSPCTATADGGVCQPGYVCATENEDRSVPVCRLPCTSDADCASEGLGSFCGTRGHCTTACDPADGTGCGEETCNLYTGNPPDPEVMCDYTDCRPIGAVADGQPCTNHYDCGARSSCIVGFCRRICHPMLPEPGECTGGQSCVAMSPIVNGTAVLYGAVCEPGSGC